LGFAGIPVHAGEPDLTRYPLVGLEWTPTGCELKCCIATSMAEGIEVDKQRAVIDDIKEDLNVRDMDVRAAAEVTGDIEKWRRIVYTTSSSANPMNEKQEVSRELSLTSPSALSFTFCEITTVCCLSHFQQLNGARYSSVAEWLACWTQAQKGPGSNRSRDAVG